ncbi:class I glutamine amidotransferase-like superfamily protein [Tasmannia lanceolata]|uniref:class I glutamine amidotransferase-like superfamily protein n=1 Tax=Tasmannia lanceolata TaxID=3420 RepID=UPI004062AA43
MAIRHLTHLPSYSKLFPFIRLPRRTPILSSLTFSSTLTTMASASQKVLVPIANGTEPMEAVIIIDVLRRAGADVTVASVEKELRIEASWGLKLVADALISDCAETTFDLISLPGGMPGSTTLRDCGVLEGMTKKHVAEGRLYSAICAAPAAVLGSWGLLNGLRATCHPSWMEKLSTAATVVESRVQQDGRVVTSRGAGTAMEFSLALVEQLYGKDKADEVAGPMVMRSHHGGDYTMTELNSVEWTFNNTPQILVPIANGSEEMEAVMIIDILRRANANVVVASVEDTLDILASRKVKLVADMLLDEAAKLPFDLIVLPGGLGGAQAFSSSEKLMNLLKKQRDSNKPYGAICASPALALEPNGLLKGKKATAYPAMCNKLSDPSEAENRVLVDGNLITSRGPGTSIEFSLAIVEKLFGREKALDTAKSLVFTNPK